MKKVLFFTLLTILTIGVDSFAAIEHYADNADYYVATNGKDSNPGTKNNPFATIEAARDALRKDIVKGLDAPKVVLIREGEYFISRPIEFTTQDSGNKRYSITYAAYPGEEAVITGGKKITGWTKTSDGKWITTVQDVKDGKWFFRDLYKNGRRCTRSRHPNTGYFKAKDKVNMINTFEFYPGDLKEWNNLNEIELVFLHDWSIARAKIEKVDTIKNHVKTAKDIALDTWWLGLGRLPDEPYFVENSIEFVDTPGEWFLDKKSGQLTYFPHPKEDINDAEFIAPTEIQFLNVQGDGEKGKFVENLHFEGLSFKYSGWLLPNENYLALQACFCVKEGKFTDNPNITRYSPPCVIEFESAKNCSLKKLTVAHLGQSAIRMKNFCRDNTVTECLVTDIAANGIMLGMASFEHMINEKPWSQADPEQAGGQNTVSNCIVEKCGQEFYGAVGLWIGLSDHNVMRNNLVRDLPYTGISLGWSWSGAKTSCHSNRIEYNHVHDVMIILSDGAGIYTLGRQDNTVLRGNLVHDVVGTKAHAPNNALRWDRGGSEMLIEHNFVYNIDDGITHFNPETRNNLFRNNIIVIKPGKELATYRLMDLETKKVYSFKGDELLNHPSAPAIIQKDKDSIQFTDNTILYANSLPGSLLGKLGYYQLSTGPQTGTFD